MIISFVETEQYEESVFREALAGHDLRFVPTLEDVEDDVELLSIFIYSRIEAEFLQKHPRLRYIVSRSGGFDHINLSDCRMRGVSVSNVANYGDTTVAEHTFALLLALSRRLREVMALPQKQQKFSYEAARAFDLAGKTLGVVGMGHIGMRVSEFAHAFHMRVLAHDVVEMRPEFASEHGFTWRTKEELLREADIITLHVRLSPWTHHFLNRESLALCRPGVLIINTARGGLIDTAALVEMLGTGQVGGAGLDVLEEERVMRASASQIISSQIIEHLRSDAAPDQVQHHGRLRDLQEIFRSDALLSLPNVVFTPHVAFNSVEAVERLNAGTVELIKGFLGGAQGNLVP